MSVHWWWNPPHDAGGAPPDPPDPGSDSFVGPETTLTWVHLLRESKDPGDEPDAAVASDRWLAGAGRPTGPQY